MISEKQKLYDAAIEMKNTALAADKILADADIGAEGTDVGLDLAYVRDNADMAYGKLSRVLKLKYGENA